MRPFPNTVPAPDSVKNSAPRSDAARVVMVGAGGLAASAGLALVSDWPCEKPLLLDIYDPEAVELSNLNRQFLFRESDAGEKKAGLLSAVLSSQARKLGKSQVSILSHAVSLTSENIAALDGSSAVLDCCDSTETKFLINDYCARNDIAFCYAGAIGETGQVLLVPPRSCFPERACLRCLFGDLSAADIAAQTMSCQSAGILGPIAAYTGLLQAEAVLDYLLEGLVDPESFRQALIRVSPGALRETVTALRAEAGCPLECGETPSAAAYNQSAEERIR